MPTPRQKVITFVLREDIYNKLEKYCSDKRISTTVIAEQAIEKFLDELKEKENDNKKQK